MGDSDESNRSFQETRRHSVQSRALFAINDRLRLPCLCFSRAETGPLQVGMAILLNGAASARGKMAGKLARKVKWLGLDR